MLIGDYQTFAGIDDDAGADVLGPPCHLLRSVFRDAEKAPKARVGEPGVAHFPRTLDGDVDHRRRHVAQHRRKSEFAVMAESRQRQQRGGKREGCWP